jgi:hypothetical protein
MPTLSVRNFSVISAAEINFRKMNVIIGPQASGKSLLCRLAYFCAEVVSTAMGGLNEDMSLDSLRDQVAEDFASWFPYSALGKGKFEISYRSGRFCVSLKRKSYRSRTLNKLTVTFNDEFSTAYENGLREVREAKDRVRPRKAEPTDFRLWRIGENARKKINALFDQGGAPSQLYIPAGRAFFTNYSKAITAFESGSLDVVTSRFGRLIERFFNDSYFIHDQNEKHLTSFDEMRKKMLKGALVNKKGVLSFVTENELTLSLGHLSSGTQEALPLLAALRWALSTGRSRPVFAEEPEVHLFPSAQMDLVRIFSWLSNVGAGNSCWVITTHSPYILTSFNDLIKAAQAAEGSPSRAAAVDKIVPRQFWVKPSSFGAYAFDGKDGILRSIMDEGTGLIDGEILDSISSTIGQQFEQLLEIQYAEK